MRMAMLIWSKEVTFPVMRCVMCVCIYLAFEAYVHHGYLFCFSRAARYQVFFGALSKMFCFSMLYIIGICVFM
jgi:hypothetical protein